MNWDQVQGKWKQFKGSAKQQWGKLTDDDLDFINGKREALIGKLQERYGIAREEAQKRAGSPRRSRASSGSTSSRNAFGSAPASTRHRTICRPRLGVTAVTGLSFEKSGI